MNATSSAADTLSAERGSIAGAPAAFSTGCRFVTWAAAVGLGLWAAASPFLLGLLAWRLWSGGTVQYLRDHGELSRRTLLLLAVSLAGTLLLCGWSLARVALDGRRHATSRPPASPGPS